MGVEKDSHYYDDYFKDNQSFNCHYKESFYYVHWTQVIVFLKKIETPEILEIGAGTGQLAHYFIDEGFKNYLGFDFSELAIETAKRKNPQLSFWIGDARDEINYADKRYNTIICLEVLEHVDQDLEIIKNIPEQTNIIFSVPNFDAPSHVRWFTSERQIKKRYFKYIDIQELVRVGNIYICKGIRSSFKPSFLQAFLASREEIKLNSFLIRLRHRLKNLLKSKSM